MSKKNFKNRRMSSLLLFFFFQKTINHIKYPNKSRAFQKIRKLHNFQASRNKKKNIFFYTFYKDYLIFISSIYSYISLTVREIIARCIFRKLFPRMNANLFFFFLKRFI